MQKPPHNDIEASAESLEGAQILYPTRWEYAVIGKSEALIEEAIFEVLDIPFEVTKKRPSGKGNFLSVHIALEVDSKEQRDSIFSALKNHKDIAMVL